MARTTRTRARADNWSDVESGDHDADRSPSDVESGARLSKIDDRPGDFAQLEKFMSLTTEDCTDLLYRRPGCLHAEPGHIIHMKDDEDSAINGRVLLVLQRLTQSLMCLGFCLHHPIFLCDHWRVYKAKNTPKRDRDSGLYCLEVHLRPFPETDEALAPRHGVTLNFQDIWNIETVSRTSRAAFLGRANESSLQRLSMKVQEKFCSGLNEAIPQPKVARPIRRARGGYRTAHVEMRQGATRRPLYDGESEDPARDGSQRKKQRYVTVRPK